MHDKHASPNVKSSFIDIQMIPDVEIINQFGRHTVIVTQITMGNY